METIAECVKILYCEYCKNKFTNKSSLFKHQRVTKYCLVLQGKIEDMREKIKAEKDEKEEKEKMEKEKIMREKEDEKNRNIIRKEKEKREEKEKKEKKRENRYRCEYCNVKFTTRINYCGHMDICLEKYKKIILDKEKEINDVNRKLFCVLEEHKEEIERMRGAHVCIIKEQRENWESIKNKWKIKKDKYRKMCSKANIKTENNTTHNVTNNNVIILQATDLSEEKLFDVFSYYGKEYFYKGSTGVAEFIQKNIMTSSSGESTVICTDVSRKTFYNNISGKQTRDPGLSILYSKLDPWIKKGNDRVYGEEWIEISEKGGDYVREKKNKLIITYRDASNISKIIKRLAEFSYVSPPIGASDF
jgi:hypothetical protein